jgi:phage-related protein
MELSKEERIIIGEDIRAAQLQELWKKPIVGTLGKGLWEIRSTLKNSIARVVFFDHKGSMILLCAFIKKTQQTPTDIIKLATKRRKEYENAS